MKKQSKKTSFAFLYSDLFEATLLTDYLQNQECISVCHHSQTPDELMVLLDSQQKPLDVILLDLSADQICNSDIIKTLRTKHAKTDVIITSRDYNNAFIGYMLKNGIAAYLPKRFSPSQLVETIEEVSEKGFYFIEKQLETVRGQLSPNVPQPFPDLSGVLSEREIEILQLICKQKTAKEIGQQLFIAPRTVEGHKNNLFAKTGAKNVAGLVIYAVQNDLIVTEDILL
ncbi:MAG: response regulator transcription factor [Flavobacteriales bacterium]|nr:response regulator transcription factor [Flavobacteriales bacterium]